MSKKEINELTPAQEAKIPLYVEKYRAIGTSTAACDRKKAEAALIEVYKHLGKPANPTFEWVDDPFQGQIKAAQYLHQRENVTQEEVREQANEASYGSLEAYWVAFYSFIINEIPVKDDGLCDKFNNVILDTGVYWTFDDHIIVSEKPCVLKMKNDKLHCEDGPALAWPSGRSLFALDGEIYPSLMDLTLKQKFANQK